MLLKETFTCVVRTKAKTNPTTYWYKTIIAEIHWKRLRNVGKHANIQFCVTSNNSVLIDGKFQSTMLLERDLANNLQKSFFP